jgi:hypothetical protein
MKTITTLPSEMGNLDLVNQSGWSRICKAARLEVGGSRNISELKT